MYKTESGYFSDISSMVFSSSDKSSINSATFPAVCRYILVQGTVISLFEIVKHLIFAVIYSFHQQYTLVSSNILLFQAIYSCFKQYTPFQAIYSVLSNILRFKQYTLSHPHKQTARSKFTISMISIVICYTVPYFQNRGDES